MLTRNATIGAAILMVALPVGMILYQSLLSGPFFQPQVNLSLGAFRLVLSDSEFWASLGRTFLVAAGMVSIALPLGGIFAFLFARTDLPGRSILEPFMLIPMFVPSIVLGFGYTVSIGPRGFVSDWAQSLLGFLPWNLYTPAALIVIAGLAVTPYVYLFVATALRGLGTDIEEAARVSGAGMIRIARDVSLPMIKPTLAFCAVFIFFLGIELFGLALIIGSNSGYDVLTVYLYKLTNRLGLPAYHLMAAVVVLMIAMTLPLVYWQRRMTQSSDRYVAMRGKASRNKALPLGRWRWIAFAGVVTWIFVAAILPLAGILLRSVVSHWGPGVNLGEAFSLASIAQAFTDPSVRRAIVNSVMIGIVGGLAAVVVYAALAIATHRRSSAAVAALDYAMLMPRAIPGLVIGLAFLWVFLFIPALQPLRSTLFSVWVAYLVVYMAYGARLVSGTLVQVAPELAEAARTCGSSAGRTLVDVTLPLIRNGLLTSWLLMFIMFEREYATGVYLMTRGTETIGAMIVSLSTSGDVGLLAALSLVNVVIVGVGVGLALRLGVKLNG